MRMFGSSIQSLQQSLNAAQLRQNVISHNIANVDTPNFKRSYVEFESLLQEAAGRQRLLEGTRTHPMHIPIGHRHGEAVQPRVIQDESTKFNNNRNNVDIDAEMAALAKNQLRYNSMVQQISHEFGMLRTSIGRR